MGGARVEVLFSFAGLIVLAFVFLIAVSRFARYRRKSRGDDFDELEGLADAGEDVGPDRGPPQFKDFMDGLTHYVLPLHTAHPDWDRLDGAVGIPGRGAFRFERNAIRFEVNAETRFEPLLAAHDWMTANPGEDPLEVQKTGRVGKLRLRKEIWPNPKDVVIQTG